MARSLIARTRPEEIQPLYAAGTLVRNHFPQLRAHFADRLGPQHAALIAEPEIDRPAGPTAWFGPAGALFCRLETASAEEKGDAAQAAIRLLDDVAGEAAKLRASGDPAGIVLAEQIDKLLVIPSLDYVYLADGRAILVGWAHAAEGRFSKARDLLAGVEAPPRPAVQCSPEAGPADAGRVRARPTASPTP